MSGFLKRTGKTVNPAGGVNPASEPNVGQYGWTKFESNAINQIIQYVDLCKKYAQEAQDSAIYIQSKFDELQDFMDFITEVYKEIKPIYDNIIPIYNDIKVRYEEMKTMNANVTRLHAETNTFRINAANSAGFAKQSEDFARASETAAKVSETNAATSAKEAKDLAEELRKGQVYRGTWNMEANNAYPPVPDTNSVWDIILNEGNTTGVTVGGKLWYWGDRLIYIKTSNEWVQVESGSNVISVNGKAGAVTLNAEDVGAVTKYSWTAKVKLGSWSAIGTFYHRAYGGKAIVTVGMTRGDFVSNARFLISWGHAQHATITQLESHGYSQIQVRLCVLAGDNCQFEILDTDYSTTSEGTEVDYQCQVDELFGQLDVLTAFTASTGTPKSTTQTEYQAIKINGNKVYHQGFMPTPRDIGAVSTGGDRLFGQLFFNPGQKGAGIYSDKASVLFYDGNSIWFHQFADGDALRWATGGSGESQIASLSAAGEFVAAKFVGVSTGVTLRAPGGAVLSGSDYMILEGKTYSFVGSPSDAHLCYNSYWNGSNWGKYDNTKTSGTLVANYSGLRYHVSEAGSIDPNQYRYKVYHEGAKPTPAEIDALSLGGGSMHGNGEIHWPQSNASLMNRDNQFISLEGGTHVMVTTGRTSADGAAYIGKNFYYDGGWKKFNNAKSSGILEISESTLTFFQSDAGAENPIQRRFKVYHEGDKPSAADFGGVPVHTADRTGADVSALHICSVPASIGGESSANVFLLSGGHNFGGTKQPLYKVSLSSRGYSGSGAIPATLCSVTSLEGSDDIQSNFYLVRAGAYLQFWMGRPTFSAKVVVTELQSDHNSGISFPMSFAGSVPTGDDRVQISVFSSYTTNYKPTYGDVGAAPTGYGLGESFPGELTTPGKSLDTFRWNGWRTYNQDTGDTGAPTPYGTCLDIGHIGNAGSFQGWAGQLFLSNWGSLHVRTNQNAGSFEGSDWTQVLTTAHPPTPEQIGAAKRGIIGNGTSIDPFFDNAYVGLWGVMGGDNNGWPWNGTDSGTLLVEAANGYTFQTASRSKHLDTVKRFYNPETGVWSAWRAVYNGEYRPAFDNWQHFGEVGLNVSGCLAWRNYGNNHVIFDASSGVAPTGATVDKDNPSQPWASTHPTLMGWNGSGTYGVRVDIARKSEFVHAPGGQKSAIDLPEGSSIRFRHGGGAWMHQFSDGNYIRFGHGTSGENTMATLFPTGDVDFMGGVHAYGGYVKSERATNPVIEWHAPGKHAWISYVPDSGGLIMGASNGAGAIASQAVHFTPSANTFSGRINVSQSQSRAWTGLGIAAFHQTQTDIIGEGNLHGLVTGRYHYPGAYVLEMGLGSIHYANSSTTSHVLWANDGGSYNKVWYFHNSGVLVNPDSHWRMEANGHLWGLGYGSQYLHEWASQSFAPISDEKLKKNFQISTKSALDDIAKIEFKSYDWKDESQKSVKIGVTAQQMEAIDPCYAKDIETYGDDGVTVETSIKSLDTANVLALALKAIQEQSVQIETLQARVAELEEKLNV